MKFFLPSGETPAGGLCSSPGLRLGASGNGASLVFAASALQTLFLWPLQAHRNLSQLPNFAFSVPLAYFLLSQQADLPEQELSSAREQASVLIRQALTMFPGGGCTLTSPPPQAQFES